jgi:hypothetical protein
VWRFQKEKSLAFTINTVLPAVNLGPLIPKPEVRSDISGLSFASIILMYFTGDNRDVTTFHNYNVYVHVEHVALAHVHANEEVARQNGERFLIAAGNYSGQEVLDIVRKHFPEHKDNMEEGKPGNYPQFSNIVDGTKATRNLGIEYKDLETTIVELVEKFDTSTSIGTTSSYCAIVGCQVVWGHGALSTFCVAFFRIHVLAEW